MPSPKLNAVFIGTGDIGLPSFHWLCDNHSVTALVTQPDKPAGRSNALKSPEIKLAALSRGVHVLQPHKLRSPDAVAQVQALHPDVIVVMAYGQLLPKAILDIPKLACLNLHASLLPRWRGAAPIHAAIEAGDSTTGITVMFMDEGLDTGDILLMREIPICATDTAGSLHDRLAAEAPLALADALALLTSQSVPRIPQPAAGVTYASKLSRENGLLDFSTGRIAVERRVRAMNPWPAASTSICGKRLKVFSALPLDSPILPPGEILTDSRGLIAGTGDGSILLNEVQLEGKKCMHSREFLRGFDVSSAKRLGA